MRLRVLYASDGHIVSLARSEVSNTEGPGQGAPQIAVQPSEDQRVAIVDVAPAWNQRSLADIHQAFTVMEGPEGAYLLERGDSAEVSASKPLHR